jgi:ssRNA-specific RNase YbeY (16S rRNA maturation enzyme)
VIHGVLHLLGYDDGTVRERRVMKGKEEEYLGKVKGL